MALGEVFETLAELGVAVGGFDELELGGGRLEVVAQEGGVVAVARGVDADADADGMVDGLWWCDGQRGRVTWSLRRSVGERDAEPRGPPRGRTVRKLVMRGQSLKM